MMTIRKILSAGIFATALFGFGYSASAIAQDSPVGQWKTIDDETKEPKSIVEITDAGGKLSGKIVKLFRPADQDQNPKCVQCKDERKDQPLIGLNIIWDIEKRDSDWGNGKILDPNNGKTYKAKLKVVDGGQKLEVRGFLGISLLGRTQTWVREK